jgi:hypothetical protein
MEKPRSSRPRTKQASGRGSLRRRKHTFIIARPSGAMDSASLAPLSSALKERLRRRCYNPIMPKASKNSQPASTNPEPNWVKHLPLVAAFLSILASTFVGILSILNSRAISRLDREVFIPSLRYRLVADPEITSSGAIELTLSLEVSNYGQALAKNVVVSMSWEELELGDCLPSPPYQYLKPIEPIVERNLSYRLETLPVGGVFVIVCQTVSLRAMSLPPHDPDVIEATPSPISDQSTAATPSPISVESRAATLGAAAGTFSADGRWLTETRYVSRDDLNVTVTADNAAPATEIENQTQFFFRVPLHTPIPSPTP